MKSARQILHGAMLAAAVVVRPEHIGVPAAGDDAGAFLDSWVANVSEQPDARRNFPAGLGGIAGVQ